MKRLQLFSLGRVRLAAILVMGIALAAQPAGAQQSSEKVNVEAVSHFVDSPSARCQLRIENVISQRSCTLNGIVWQADVTNRGDAAVTVAGYMTAEGYPPARAECVTQAIPATTIPPHSTVTITGFALPLSCYPRWVRVTLHDTSLGCKAHGRGIVGTCRLP